MPADEPKARTIKKAALAHFKDGQVLFVRDNKNEDVFIFPGGKIEEGETDEQCVVRECREEMSVEVDPASVKYLHKFLGPAHGKPGVMLDIRLYTAEFLGEPQPSQEIVELGYFDTQSDSKHISEIGATQIMPWLKTNGYIN
jgi:8-oxo-dGTP diphosphatase